MSAMSAEQLNQEPANEALEIANQLDNLAYLLRSAEFSGATPGNTLQILQKLAVYKVIKDDLNKDQSQSLAARFGRLYEAFNQQGVEAMLNDETSNVKKGGKSFFIESETYVSAKKDQKDALAQWLRDHDHGELITETMNAQRLSAFVRELKDEGDLPEDLAPLVNVYEKTTVGIRAAK